eukprot:m.45111 g.45111  ORF g.45111 m.45111 type:complete len:149 (-) comp10654_c1_seq2:3381-3827(-)
MKKISYPNLHSQAFVLNVETHFQFNLLHQCQPFPLLEEQLSRRNERRDEAGGCWPAFCDGCTFVCFVVVVWVASLPFTSLDLLVVLCTHFIILAVLPLPTREGRKVYFDALLTTTQAATAQLSMHSFSTFFCRFFSVYVCVCSYSWKS